MGDVWEARPRGGGREACGERAVLHAPLAEQLDLFTAGGVKRRSSRLSAHSRSSSTSPTDGETTPIEPTMLEGRTKISSHAEAM